MSELRFNDFKNLEGVQFVNCEDLQAQNPFLRRIKIDSRQIENNDVFWTLIGERFDAHDFVPAVALSGALCAVVERLVETSNPFPQVVVPDTLRALQQFAALNRLQFEGMVIALTGSNGKTSTKEMIAHLLEAKWSVHKTSGNLNNHIGCPLTLLQLNNQFDFAVVELGTNHPGEIAALAQITKPDAALITNIGPAHLEYFKTLEAVAKEKMSLFDQLEADQVAFVNYDDPFLKSFQRDDVRVVTFGLSQDADVTGKIVEVDAAGNFTFTLNDKVRVRLQVPGQHNVVNALAASAVGLFYGLNEQEIRDRLQSYSAFDKRMQLLQKNGLRIINDAYNANPESMRLAFETLARMERGTGLFLVLGDMLELGEQAAELHQQVLQQALNLNPQAILLMGDQMCAAAEKLNSEKIACFPGHEALAAELKNKVSGNALIFIKGSRGLQMEKVLDFI